MAENYREQQQEEAEGIVDAGGFENDPGTGMIAEDQETAAAADAEPTVPTAVPAQNDQEAIDEAEASENVQVDLHEDNGSGVDMAVIIIILLLIISCVWYAFLEASKQPSPQIIAEQQAVQQDKENAEYEPPYEVVELSEGVAAIVNGEVIEEATIDDYVASYRKLYRLEDDNDWAGWMTAYGFTPQQIRDTAIAGFIEQALVSQAIAEHGIEVSQADIDEIYDATRANYDTDAEWQEALQEIGLTDEAFREQCAQEAEKQALVEYLGDQWFTPEEEDAELLVAIKQYYPEYTEAESLDGIPEEKLEPVRELVVYYAQQDAYNKFLNDAKENGEIKMSAMPSDVPYDANMLMGFFAFINNQLEFQNQQGQEQPNLQR